MFSLGLLDSFCVSNESPLSSVCVIAVCFLFYLTISFVERKF